MKLRTLAAATVLAAAMPSIANAAFIINTVDYGFTTTGATITFDTALPAGYTLSGNYVLQTGSNGNGAAPATSPTTSDTTTYLSSLSTARLSGSALYNYVSLYWGSIDSYNTLQLFNDATLVGTITGGQVSAFANGNQVSSVTNRLVTIQSDVAFNSLAFLTTQPAFEVDNITFLSSVPEPATWLSMIAGFGLIGAGLRRRRSLTVNFA